MSSKRRVSQPIAPLGALVLLLRLLKKLSRGLGVTTVLTTQNGKLGNPFRERPVSPKLSHQSHHFGRELLNIPLNDLSREVTNTVELPVSLFGAGRAPTRVSRVDKLMLSRFALPLVPHAMLNLTSGSLECSLRSIVSS